MPALPRSKTFVVTVKPQTKRPYSVVLLVWIHDSIPLVNTLSLWNNLETTASPTDIMHYEQDHAAHWTTFDLASVACVISRSELPKGS